MCVFSETYSNYFDMFYIENKHSRRGQGDYYRSNTIRFQKEREEFLKNMSVFERSSFGNILFPMKTSKSTKAPIRFKGWKNKR